MRPGHSGEARQGRTARGNAKEGKGGTSPDERVGWFDDGGPSMLATWGGRLARTEGGWLRWVGRSLKLPKGEREMSPPEPGPSFSRTHRARSRAPARLSLRGRCIRRLLKHGSSPSEPALEPAPEPEPDLSMLCCGASSVAGARGGPARPPHSTCPLRRRRTIQSAMAPKCTFHS
jgi:hypothetical protein